MVICGSSSLRYSRLMTVGREGENLTTLNQTDVSMSDQTLTLTTIFQFAIGSSDSSALV